MCSLLPRRRWVLVGGGMGLLSVFLVLRATGQDATKQQATESASDAALAEASWSNWPSFRGPNSLGRARGANPPLKWNAKGGTGIEWKVTLPKHGMSSPVAWGDRLFLTGADEVSRQVYCVDGRTGGLLWKHDVSGVPGAADDGKLPDVLDETGFAASTPTTNGQYIAAIFATGELVCLNRDGERIWIQHLGIPHNHYGHASSLLCRGNRLFVQYDKKENAQVLAFDLKSGDLVWQADRRSLSWSSPILAEHQGKTELVLTDSQAVEGYDPTSGKSLWRVECLSGEVASSAAFANGTVFVANEGARASAIAASGPEQKIVWQWDEALPDAASPVANDDYLVLPTAFGTVSCLDTKTGKVFWQHDFDNGFSSSPILVDDRVYATDLSGMTQIFKMDDEFVLLSTADVGEPVYATPAFIKDRIYVRSLSHLYCIRENGR